MSRPEKFLIAAAAVLSLLLAGCVAQTKPKSSGSGTPENFHSLMPPKSLLRDDTIEAASHDRATSRLAYVGVWARSGEACAMMDQTAFEGFAVITPATLRRSDETCTFDQGEPEQGYLRFEASCKAGRRTRARELTVYMQDAEKMQLGIDGTARSLTRCHLPE
ncbi:MAG: hypothetical protein RIC18_03075 [Hoeflea sp.]|uniref:hypothetical protein n=1 Tax=Hoeflea sp. TaxID=1940281 RepID=UPI0032F04806